jgi:glutamine amidotransferase
VISIVDYGIGNVGSVINMLRHIGAPARLVSTPAEIEAADALILPGVGHFGYAMDTLDKLRLVEPIRQRVLKDRVPILGICLGMQLLGQHSEEGDAAGLGFIQAKFIKIQSPPGSDLKVPHMGWNLVSVQRENPLLSAEGESRFYFVHSYKAVCERDDEVIATCNHGEEFCCAYGRDNVYGVQFHPEKSHRFGMDLFRRYVEFAC